MKGIDLLSQLAASLGVTDLPIDPALQGFLSQRNARSKSPLITYSSKANDVGVLVLVGCGGTGSDMLPLLVQYLVSKNKTDPSFVIPQILIIDGDIVEEKNLARQRFGLNDIGKNKADALAERYSSVFGIAINSYSSFINGKSLTKAINMLTPKGATVIIGAVDNNRARMAILETFKSLKDCYWIDCGNETWNGQAILSANEPVALDTAPDYARATMKDTFIKLPYLPHFFLHFPRQLFTIPKDPLEPAGVCAQHVAENPQTIQANSYSALSGFTLVSQIFEKSIGVYKIYFDSKLGAMVSKSFSPASLEELKVDAKKSEIALNQWFESLCFGDMKKLAKANKLEAIPDTGMPWTMLFATGYQNQFYT